ncbi:MAG: N-acetylmuramoyl-L-alanine amidase [Myxococcota bacterium]
MTHLSRVLPLLVLAAACGVESPSAPVEAPSRGTSALETAFSDAARAYQVPVSVLKAVAWTETRISPAPGLESGSGGKGLMQLARRGDWDTLGDAARLTGVTEGRLTVDPVASIHGGAAVLRKLFDQQRQGDTSLDPYEPGDWYGAVSLYPGFESATGAADYAADVFLALEAGFTSPQKDGDVLQAPLATRWRRHAPEVTSRRDAVKEYPAAAQWVASPNYTSGRSTYEFVVIHTAQGSYSGTISWCANPNSNVSAHYVVRSSDGAITQMVEHRNTAWHAQCYNARSIGIEHEGFVADPGRWYTDAMYRESAKLTKWIADRHGIPKTRSRIIGHSEVAPGCNTSRHTDPGSGWNWTKYMNLVTGSAPTPTTGVLIGVIYTGGNSANRLPGATVTVNGQSVTSDANGVYQFTLPPGSYTATATKSGYGSASTTKTVTSGAQVWGSMELNPTQATGTLRGTVFVYNPANPSDMSQRIAGATVTVNGQSQTTPADGNWLFTLPPGTYTVSVSKAGYQNNSATRTVTAGQTIWGSVGMSPTQTADVQAPTVAISFPANDATLTVGAVELKGTASDDRGAVNNVQVSLNGGAAVDVPVSGGAFAIDMLLRPGSNTVVVTAKDAAGNTGRAQAVATFKAGVRGVVSSGEPAAPVAGAALSLREAGSGVEVSTATTNEKGEYELGVMTVGADYLLVVKAAGYLTASETVTVPEDQQLVHDVTLVPGTDEVGELVVSFVEPMDGATVTTDTVTVYGTVSGFEVVAVAVNGVAGELLGSGGFSATVPVVEGENVIEAVASGVGGERVSARITVTRKLVGAGPGPSSNNVPQEEGAKGGCVAAPAFELLALLGVLPLLRRRRR